MAVVCRPLNVVMRPAHHYEPKSIIMNGKEMVKWNCILLLIYHCYDNPDSKNKAATPHGVAVKRSHVRYVMTKNHNISRLVTSKMLVKDTEVVSFSTPKFR